MGTQQIINMPANITPTMYLQHHPGNLLMQRLQQFSSHLGAKMFYGILIILLLENVTASDLLGLLPTLGDFTF